ncbi:MAG: FAD-binding oxidoreductase [Desulforegulaceae bacterium]|nr:FAD-binding oxidoreductase [Desulforegulaceae bacterium]
MNKNNFEPKWINNPPEKNSYRSIFKWGNPSEFKHPNKRLYSLIKKTFSLSDKDFFRPASDTGNDEIKGEKEINIKKEVIEKLIYILGKENVESDIYSRVKYSNGKTLEEAIDLREKKIENITDIAVHPRSKNDISKIINICSSNKIPIHVFSGGSSVTIGHKCSEGGVTIVMSTHMNRIKEFNETDQTITVEPGIFGPDLERILNNAPKVLNSKRKYTCGHFPQSFEYSTAGGWVVTLGSGQASTYYGDAKDLVISQEYITPKGIIKTADFPASAAGPDIGQIFLGSEGVFGILVELKLKVFRFMPENRKKFSFIFPSWKEAVEACREITQSEGGVPAVFRISDEEETDVGLKLYGIEGTPLDFFMKLKGYFPMKRCLLIGHTEGLKSYSKAVLKNIKKTAKNFNGMYLTGYPVSKWEHGRYSDPYMREDLNDFGIYIDTLETSVKWSNLHEVHTKVRNFVKSRPKTICMTHSSHFYPQGTNLYFIFIGKFSSKEEYLNFQRKIIEKIDASGGSLSHHHGIGRMMAHLFKNHIGENEFEFFKNVKNYFDENHIMNPKGTLGLS